MFNQLVAIILLIIISPIFIALYILIFLIDGPPVIFSQRRVGQNNSKFMVYKFRSMKKNITDIPTHMVKNPANLLSRSGSFIRRFSLDELPQVVNIIKGQMTFIGPRPALHNQENLIKLRTEKGIHQLKPGVTGWAQVHGRDKLSILEKVTFDEYYLKNKSILLDIKIMLLTIKQILLPKGVSH